MPRLIGIVSAVLIYMMQPLYAAASSDAAPVITERSYPDPVSAGSIMQLLAGLILVVALIFLLAWGLKRFSGLPGQHRSLRVIASLPLSTREKVVLVQAGEKQLLLGVAPGRVNLLESYDQPLLNPEEGGEFAVRLQKALNRKESK